MKHISEIIPQVLEQNDIGTLTVFFDGACEPKNPGGVATCGWLAKEPGGAIVATGAKMVREGPGATNNIAEYCALGKALRWIVDNRDDEILAVFMFGDSKLVVEQVNGRWRCKKEHLQKLRDRCLELIDDLKADGVAVHLNWVPREKNEEADALSRLAYEQHTGKSFPVRRPKW